MAKKIKTKRGIDRTLKHPYQKPTKHRRSTKKLSPKEKLAAKKSRLRQKKRTTSKDIVFDKLRGKHLRKNKAKKSRVKSSRHRFLLSGLKKVGSYLKSAAGKVIKKSSDGVKTAAKVVNDGVKTAPKKGRVILESNETKRKYRRDLIRRRKEQGRPMVGQLIPATVY